MISIGDFRGGVEALVEYIFEHETEDFIEILESGWDESSPAHHVYFQAFVAWNGLRGLDGKGYEPLWAVLHEDYNGQYFYCTADCGYVGTKAEPIQDRLILNLPANEPIPAGVCPVCAGTVVEV